MNTAIKQHLKRKQIVLAKRSDEPMSFTERAPDFFRWFKEDVMGFDSYEYRREFWYEARLKGHTIGHIPHTLSDHLRNRGRRSEIVLFDALCISLLMGGSFAIWVIRRKIDQHLHNLRRPSYYETELIRRRALSQERRRIKRRTTLNPRPTANQLRDAFMHARESVANMIKLGTIMEDLECYIDNSLVFGDGGRIVARKGGIRRYIQSEIPDLYKSYKTLMRYKALAKKFRQAIGISDPIPASSVLPQDDKEITAKSNSIEECKEGIKRKKSAKNKINKGEGDWKECDENMVRTNSYRGDGDGVDDEIRRRVKEVLEVCEGTFLDLASMLALKICEDTIPHKLYGNKIHDYCKLQPHTQQENRLNSGKQLKQRKTI